MYDKSHLLKHLVGYVEGRERIAEREAGGSDFSDKKGHNSAEIAKLHPKRLQLEVSEIIEETASTKTYRLRRVAGALPPFQAGQYINLFVEVDGVQTARPYAISSCPSHRDYYDLTIKVLENGFVTNHLLPNAKVGDRFSSTGPMGTFYYNPIIHAKKLVFLAGGSGGAPARAMIESVLNKGVDAEFYLIYGNSFEHDVIFQDTYRALADKHPNFHLTEIISRPTENFDGLTGYLSAERIRDAIGAADDAMFYVCGPTPFNEYCTEQLHQLGVQDKRIRVECNGPPKQPSTLSGWPRSVEEMQTVKVTVNGKGSFEAAVGEPLLNSLERNGYFVENACRSGECSLCRVKVLQGEVFNPSEAKLRKSDEQFGWTHSCVAFPLSDIEILY